MRYDLAQMTRRAKNPRRTSIKIRDIRTPTMFAGDLYRSSYKPAIDVWADAIPAILSEYSRTLGQTTDSPADIEQKMQEAERRFNLLSLTITPNIQRWALKVETFFRKKWRAGILSATSVDIGTMIGPADVRQTLEAAINWNVALVKDVSAEAQRRMTSIIYDGLRGNKPAREVAKELRGAVDLGRKRSISIASDQLAKITSSLADERRREAGMNIWQWLHSGKKNFREDHKARDGDYYSDDPADVGKVVDGKTVKAAPEDRVGQRPYCGCRSQGVLVFD